MDKYELLTKAADVHGHPKRCKESGPILNSPQTPIPSHIHREYAERKNTGKAELSHVDMNCLKPCANVLTFGATKYSRNNWKKGMKVSKILDSLMRHIGDLQDGKVLDEESQLSIIGHIQCNALFLGNKNNEDDMCNGGLYK
jgi:hypothetical protein